MKQYLQILMLLALTIYFSACNSNKKEDDSSSTLAALVLLNNNSASAVATLIGTWKQTSLSINGSSYTISGTFLTTFTDSTITEVNNGSLISANNSVLSFNCNTSYSYTKTSLTYTSTVTSDNCIGSSSIGNQYNVTYTISGNTLSTNYTSSSGKIISQYTRQWSVVLKFSRDNTDIYFPLVFY